MALQREEIIESAQAQQGGSASVAANAAAGAASAARAWNRPAERVELHLHQ